MTTYIQYNTRELSGWVFAEKPTPINLILDRPTIDFLLALNEFKRHISQNTIQSIIRSIERIGWICSETIHVTSEGWLGDGEHRLMALRQLGYPPGFQATVVFGTNSATMSDVGRRIRHISGE